MSFFRQGHTKTTDHGLHEDGHPEMPVDKIVAWRRVGKSSHDSGHQITDDDEVADAHAEALDGDCSIKDDGGVWVRDLAEGEETRGSSVEVFCAASLQVEAESGCKAGPDYDEDTQDNAHV